jgi:hypothetical protein
LVKDLVQTIQSQYPQSIFEVNSDTRREISMISSAPTKEQSYSYSKPSESTFSDGQILIPFEEIKFTASTDSSAQSDLMEVECGSPHQSAKLLGQGSFGFVRKGYCRGTPVAVKCLVPRAIESQVEEFYKEVQILMCVDNDRLEYSIWENINIRLIMAVFTWLLFLGVARIRILYDF